jgi:isoleucyl-tRNA synthetase
MFKIKLDEKSNGIIQFKSWCIFVNQSYLAWTTTPWTLPSNTALAVGKNIDYVLVKTFNPFLFSKDCKCNSCKRIG